MQDYDPMVRVSPTYRRRWLQRRREEEKEKPRLGSRGHLNIGRIYVSRSRMREKGGRRRKEPREERDAEWSAYKVDTKWSGLHRSVGGRACVGASSVWSLPRLFTRCTFRLHRIHVQAGVQMRIYAATERVHCGACVLRCICTCTCI